jgi:large subunit ribosomal protein L31
MKDKIHPKYHKAKVRCACGNEFEIGSTIKEIKVEICSNCHHFLPENRNWLIPPAGLRNFAASMVRPRKYRHRPHTTSRLARPASRWGQAITSRFYSILPGETSAGH